MRIRSIQLFLIIALLTLINGCDKKSDGPQTELVKIYLVALEGTELQGKTIGCNDKLIEIPVDVTIERSVLEATLRELLTAKSTEEHKNFVKGPGLILAQVTVANTIADVYFVGDFDISGACDITRIREQIYETTKQFNLTRINFFVNNLTLERYLDVAGMSF